MFKSCSPLALALGLTLVGPTAAQITPEEAFEIARARAHVIEPALDSPLTKVNQKESGDVIVLEISDPFYLNGQRFWRTYSWFEHTARGVRASSGVGIIEHQSRAVAPLPSVIPPEFESYVIDWLSYWDGAGGLDPELRVGARPTHVYTFRFYQGLFGPRAYVAVDQEGRTFHPDPENPLFPWPEDTVIPDDRTDGSHLRMAKFQSLFADVE